jgi:galactosamine-6-phosphate isomerase
MSRRAAAHIVRELRLKPSLLLGAASGETPTRAYERLADVRASEPGLFRALRVLKLDEWLGVPMRDPATCESYFRRTLLEPLGVPRSRYEGFHSQPKNPRAECARLARWLQTKGPMDLCVLGLGRNGHLLMNEPATALDPAPHVARLAATTRRHSMLGRLKRAPREGLTFGMADVLQSKTVLLLVSGRHKVKALRRMLRGGVSTCCPASLLWLHPAVTIYCDAEAGRALLGLAA